MLNIAFLTHTSNYYGANRSLIALIEGLSVPRHRLFLVAPAESNMTRALASRGVLVAILPEVRVFRRQRQGVSAAPKGEGTPPAYTHTALRLLETCRDKLVQQLRKWGIRLVYSNSAMVNCGADAASALGIPHIWHLREFGDLDYSREPLAGWAKTRNSILRSHATISVTHAVRRHFCGSHEPERDFVVDNGIMARKRFEELRCLRKQRNNRVSTAHPFSFVLVGVVQEGKGQAAAIRAFSSLKDTSRTTRLVIVGGGNIGQLQGLAKQLGVHNQVEFTGYVDDPITAMLNADVALMCSRCEAFGRVTAEAMASGLPVIGRDAGGTPELIENGTSGLLYAGDEESLAACMSKLASDPRRAAELGDAGWVIARERFSIEKYASNIWNIMEKTGK